MRPISHAAHKKFVDVEGWSVAGTGRSKAKTGDHFRYTLTLADGDVLFTRVSHGTGEIGDPGRIAHILRQQLRVSEDDFWACVERGVLPPRPQPPQAAIRGEQLDYKLVRNLIDKVGLSQQEVAGLSKEQAVARWHEYLADPPPNRG